jgi:capsular polysaccharide biosynthesis protein/glycosyltransferase involved in cell wall biosynthesis
MRVLLLSPLRGLDPACGDIVYTETLLSDPPPGVEYETYAEAIARGALVEHACRPALRRAWRSGRGRWQETWTTMLAKAVNLLRGAHVLFWEPFRVFSVRPGEFDLIHVHVFNCGFREIDCPVVVSNALPVRYLYTDARGFSVLRVWLLEAADRFLAGIFGVNLTSYWLPSARRVIAFSKYLAAWYRNEGIAAASSIDVVPIYLPAAPLAPVSTRPRRIGFIAKDFEAKGGTVLLEAFELVRASVPDAELVILGSPARFDEATQKARGIRWLPLVPREELLESILPTFDVFAYPTQFDGMPLVLLEAMSRGIAIAAASYRAIPEMLDHGRAGLLSPLQDAHALTKNLLALLEPKTNQHFRAAARRQFDLCYSTEVVLPQLAASYAAALIPEKVATRPLRVAKSPSSSLRQIPLLRRLGNRYGRSYWRLPSILRRRLYWESSIPRLRGAQTWRCGAVENVPRVDALDAIDRPTTGHRLAAHPFRTSAPFVTRLDAAWLVGKYASPITLCGRLILSSFRDEPRMLGLEQHQELESWLTVPNQASELPELENVWPMVNRLQTNYFHWLIEWCGRLELIEAFRDQTGCAPKLLIPQTAPNYIRESLSLLGFGPESWIPWDENSTPRRVRNLVLPSFRGTTVAQSPAALQWLRRRFLSAICAEVEEPHRRIYIPRPRGGWRCVLNDEEVVEYLRGEGFDILEPQRLTLPEQIRYFSQASLIVSLHGSGLTNVLFAPQAAVLELFGAYGDGVWFGMTARLGQPYEALTCKSVGDDVVVDLKVLKKRVAALSTGRHANGALAHV